VKDPKTLDVGMCVDSMAGIPHAQIFEIDGIRASASVSSLANTTPAGSPNSLFGGISLGMGMSKLDLGKIWVGGGEGGSDTTAAPAHYLVVTPSQIAKCVIIDRSRPATSAPAGGAPRTLTGLSDTQIKEANDQITTAISRLVEPFIPSPVKPTLYHSSGAVTSASSSGAVATTASADTATIPPSAPISESIITPTLGEGAAEIERAAADLAGDLFQRRCLGQMPP